MILNQFFALLSNRVITLVLSLVLIFTCLTMSLDGLLERRVASRLQGLREKGHRVVLEQFREPYCSPEQNAAPFYRAAMELTSATTLPNSVSVRELLASNPDVDANPGGALGLLAQGTSQPGCFNGLKVEQGYRMQLPNLIAYRRLALIAAVDAVRQARTGHTEAAVARCIDLSHFVRRFGLGPSVICAAMRMGAAQRLLEAVEALPPGTVASHGALKDELALLHDQLDGDLKAAVDGEIACTADLYSKVRGKSYGAALVEVQDSLDAEAAMMAGLTLRLGGNWVNCLDELAYLDVMESQYEAIARGEKPAVGKMSTLPYAFRATLTPNMGRLWTNHQEMLKRFDALLR